MHRPAATSPVNVPVRRLSSPVAPIPAAAHTWPATEPHALRLRALHPCIPPPPQDPPSAPPVRACTCTCARIAAIAKRACKSLHSLANRFAPPWPQLIIVGTFETFTTCSRRWSISFWPTSSFLPSDLSIAVGTVLARGRVRSRGAQVRSARIFLVLGVRLVDLV